ncbi:hypothetical protein CCACVL1_06455 [Corchorus capsularis]|uniref:FYR C-terminal domain-containing protein n=1 Tax=Corchorus capsularis TaxID=210143 RepID=A0A1R3JF80_COCAP|nr:hypothetical protein CCACVL1_06455 [Corchorus capsularis]
MAKTKEGEESAKSDGLEIISIGSLYIGPWDKKYWSSSRGKDRYPYPVGYQAVRAHNGSTYKMEIDEGPKGPLFMVSCDGQSCSGQTPDIAWDKFQKTGCSNLKIWHGKRFSCKMDGVEFFGFKNPLVQRLLRELVANVNGTAEQSLLSLSYCDEASRMEQDNRSPSICSPPDVLPHLARPQVRKKRSTRCDQNKSVNGTGLKRLRSKDLTYDAEASNLAQGNQGKPKHGFPMTHIASREANNKLSGASALHSKSVQEENYSSAKDSFPSKSVEFFDHQGEKEAESKFVSSQDAKSTGVANHTSKEVRLLDRSRDSELEGFSVPIKTEDRPGDSQVPNDSLDINDVHLCAPDTLDFEDSEKSDFESVGQEMAKLMMTVLLPQAIPLLKESSKKKRETISPSKVFPSVVNSEDIDDVCMKLYESSANVENNFVNKNPKNALNGTGVVDTNDSDLRGILSPVQLSGKDIGAETASTNSTYQAQNKVYTRRKVSKQDYSTRKYTGPLSESIICRDSGYDCATNKSAVTEASLVSTSCQSSEPKPCNRDVFGATAMLEGQSDGLSSEKTTTNCKPEMTVLSNQNQKFVCASEAEDVSCLLDPCVSLERGFQENCGKERLEDRNGCFASCQNQVTSFCDKNRSKGREDQGGLDVNHYRDIELNSDLGGIVNLVGGYFHPLPISSVLMGSQGNQIHICVSCGLLVDKDRTLFIYKVAIEEPRTGCPTFVGYTSVTFPFSEIDLERCGLQFTPDGQFLVLLDSIKTPYCREGKIDCICPICSSGCSNENAVKIVQVNPGYVSLVAKMKTVENLQCILVCKNNYLVAGGKSGRLHLWVMNSTWSAWLEDFIIPAGECIPSCVVELKIIPKCAHLVIGRNDFGEFFVWDILERVIISRFSACGDPVKQFIPISLLSWKPFFSNAAMNGHVDEIIAATKNSFSEENDCSHLPLEGNIAVWLLVSTVTDSDAQHKHSSSHCQENPPSWWRLALLVKDRVILGSTLDPRAAAIGASIDRGIIGRDDGLVSMWDLATGTRLGVLHNFKGGSRVSCIATDDLRPDVVAIAADNGQLLVYLHNHEKFANKQEK